MTWKDWCAVHDQEITSHECWNSREPCEPVERKPVDKKQDAPTVEEMREALKTARPYVRVLLSRLSMKERAMVILARAVQAQAGKGVSAILCAAPPRHNGQQERRHPRCGPWLLVSPAVGCPGPHVPLSRNLFAGLEDDDAK